MIRACCFTQFSELFSTVGGASSGRSGPIRSVIGGGVGHEKPLDGPQTLFHGPHVCKSLFDLFGRVEGPHGRFWAV